MGGRRRTLAGLHPTDNLLQVHASLVLDSRGVIGISDLPRVPVCHRLQRIDKIDKFEAVVRVLIIPTDVVDDVLVFKLLSALMLRKKHSKIVRVHNTVCILIDHPEDRQD